MRHTPDLYEVSHGSPEREAIWTWLLDGPFLDEVAMRARLDEATRSSDLQPFAVVDRTTGKAVGMACYLAIEPAARRLEVGFIWYALSHRGGAANDEAMLLMLGEAFDRLGYRRVEWKCDAENERSRRAALRLGFTFEGVFRQHMIVKGRNRDTAWFSLLDSEWPAAKARLEAAVAQPPSSTQSFQAHAAAANDSTTATVRRFAMRPKSAARLRPLACPHSAHGTRSAPTSAVNSPNGWLTNASTKRPREASATEVVTPQPGHGTSSTFMVRHGGSPRRSWVPWPLGSGSTNTPNVTNPARATTAAASSSQCSGPRSGTRPLNPAPGAGRKQPYSWKS